MRIRFPQSSRRAFTLIELLVVVVIIGILAAILFAGIGRFRDYGKTIKCTSNLRQVAAAMTTYAAENNGRYPFMWGDPAPVGEYTTWIYRLQPYLNNKGNVGRESAADFMSCPAKTQSAASNVATYGINSYMGIGFANYVASTNWCYYTSRVPRPSQIILIGDMQAANSEVIPTSDKKSLLGNQSYGPGFRHGAGNNSNVDKHQLANVAFCDGHVEGLKSEQLLLSPPDLAGNPAGSKSRWKWW